MTRVNREDLVFAIEAIADIPQLEMNHDELVEDVVALTISYGDQDSFLTAVREIVRAFRQLISGRSEGTPLSGNLESWKSHHFQSARVNGQRADLRIAYQVVEGKIRVRGFGNRHIPSDFYQRIYTR